MEKLSETMEKMSQTMERVLQVMEKIPETIEKMNQTMEKATRIVEKLPQTMEKMPQTMEKLPQTVDKLPYQEEWLEAMREGDGFKLMELVAREPHLLTLRYKGRNALHLAMRHDWYGLVHEILSQFQHLHTTKEEEGSSSNRLDLDVLRDLLMWKEGVDQMSETPEAGSSGLDVLAMAVIHCHQGINTLLVRTISSLPNLFAEDNIYKDVVVACESCTKEPVKEGEEKDSVGSKMLREFLEKSFPNFTSLLKLDHAPDMLFVGRENQTEKKNSPDDDSLRDDPVICSWMLTCPFLPLSEYLILDYCRNWPENNLLNSSAFDAHLSERQIENPGSFSSYVNYLVTISDTRRLVYHHAVLCSSAKTSELHPLIPWIRTMGISDREDSSGRSVLHVLAALGMASRARRLVRCDLFDLELTAFALWVYRRVWEWNNWWCQINLSSVHRANGYVYYKNQGDRGFSPKFSIADIILTSPHLTESDRSDWVQILSRLSNSGEVFSRACVRPSVHAGAVSDRVVTLMQLSIFMGYTSLVQYMAQDKKFYDCAGKSYRGYDYDYHDVLNWDNVPDRQYPESRRDFRRFHDRYVSKSALHVAAEQAEPEMLRMMLETGKFDPQYQDEEGNTLLHAAVHCEDPTSLPTMLIDFVEIPNECSLVSRDQSLMTEAQQREKERYRESRRQGCINLLLQEGLDIWEINKSGNIPDPGTKASPGYSLWWYERLTQETQERKASFSAAGTAVSVTAALVATASYIGPLQPPLGYSGSDEAGVSKVQTEFVAVRVFFVLNTLAFYLAIAAVVLSLTPSLPVPYESTRGELKRIRRSVTWALMLLIVSLIATLSAFASASVVVIPNAERWNQRWLTAGPVVTGCIVCVVVLILCCKRAIKLMCHKNSTIARTGDFIISWIIFIIGDLIDSLIDLIDSLIEMFVFFRERRYVGRGHEGDVAVDQRDSVM